MNPYKNFIYDDDYPAPMPQQDDIIANRYEPPKPPEYYPTPRPPEHRPPEHRPPEHRPTPRPPEPAPRPPEYHPAPQPPEHRPAPRPPEHHPPEHRPAPRPPEHRPTPIPPEQRPPEHHPSPRPPKHRPTPRPIPPSAPPPFEVNGRPLPPPPEIIPQRPVGNLLRIESGAISGCLYNYTYVWLRTGRSFWFYPTFVGRNSISGYRYARYGWVYLGFDLDSIEAFYCAG